VIEQQTDAQGGGIICGCGKEVRTVAGKVEGSAPHAWLRLHPGQTIACIILQVRFMLC
jgi:hypothetical protein